MDIPNYGAKLWEKVCLPKGFDYENLKKTDVCVICAKENKFTFMIIKKLAPKK